MTSILDDLMACRDRMLELGMLAPRHLVCSGQRAVELLRAGVRPDDKGWRLWVPAQNLGMVRDACTASATNTATDVTLDGLRALAQALQPPEHDCVVLTDAEAAEVRRQVEPVAGDGFLGTLTGLPLYTAPTRPECRALAWELKQQGRRPLLAEG